MHILRPFELATAEILYRLPDAPSWLQIYVWQDYDVPPGFPRLRKFLTFWNENLDGKLFKVHVASSSIIESGFRSVDFLKRLQ